MRAYSNVRSSRWIYGVVLALFVLSTVFGGVPSVVRGQAETPPPQPQIAPASQGLDGEMSAQCTPPHEPPTPKLVAPAIGSSLTTTVPSLSWKGASGYCIKYYNIQVWVAGGAMVLSAWPTTGTFTVPTGKLTWGTQYNWYVWAYNIIYGFSDPMIASFSVTKVTNDDFNFATVIPVASSYTVANYDTTTATTASDDPTLPAGCGTGQGTNSVWWSFTPNSPGTLTVSTAGSTYDTLVAIWTGTRGSLVAVPGGCNTSAISFLSKTPGTKYYIEVVQPGSLNTGGMLNLSVGFATTAVSVPFVSAGAYDGWLLETGDGTNKAASANSTDATLIVGNTPNGRSYRSFLSFTTALPSNAVIISAVVTLQGVSVSTPTPFDFYAGVTLDIRKSYFSGNIKLQLVDFNADSSLKTAGVIPEAATPTSSYSASLLSTAFPYINRAGTTQFRLRFPGDDIGNDTFDNVTFYSGDASTTSLRPTLVVTYYTPIP